MKLHALALLCAVSVVAGCEAITNAGAATPDPVVAAAALRLSLDEALVSARAGEDPSPAWVAAVHHLDGGLREALRQDCGRRCALEVEFALGVAGRALTDGKVDPELAVRDFEIRLDGALAQVAAARPAR